MKTLITSAIVAVFSINTFAASVEWREIESKKCDNAAAVPVQEESIAVLQDQSLLAFKKKDESGCNYADFYSVVRIATGTTNGASMSIVQPVMPVSRKNCRNEISSAPESFFSLATITENEIELQHVNGCKFFLLKLKPKIQAN